MWNIEVTEVTWVVKSTKSLWTGNNNQIGDTRNAYIFFERKPLSIRPFGTTRRKWNDQIKMELTEIRCEDGRWVELTHFHVQW
jgi:hypothetical protein